MTAELFGVIGSIVSSIVVVVGVLVAIRQLRHLRASNEVAALNGLIERYDRPEVRASLRFIQTSLEERMRDETFVAALGSNPIGEEARVILPGFYFYESVGAYVRMGAISERAVMMLWSQQIADIWRFSADAIAAIRAAQGPEIMDSFEHMAARSTRWLAVDGPREQSKLERMPPPARSEPPR
jgi:hypothetical protein